MQGVILQKVYFPTFKPGNSISMGTSAKLEIPTNVEQMNSNVIWIISINNLEKKNALNGEIARELHSTLLRFESDSNAKVAILRGQGGTFCAGADLSTLNNPLIDGGNLGPMGATRLNLSKPIIASIEGFAVAGGLELALWCDLRVCSTDAVFGVFCRSKGVPLIDGGTFRLERIVGRGLAMDMILTGRSVLAKEALASYLVNRVSVGPSNPSNDYRDNPTLFESVKLALQIAAHPEECMKRDRLSLLACHGLSEEEAIAKEWSITRHSLDSPDLKSAVKRFLTKL
jgi:enoyl-CoA hydratase